MKKIYSSAFALSLLAFSPAAFAQSSSAASEPPDTRGTGHIGVGVLLNSEYLGSADENITPIPYLSFQDVKGFDLFGTTLSYRVIDKGTGEGLGKWSLRAGPSVSYQQGRDSEDSQNLIGFDDIEGSVVTGGYVRSTIGPLGILVNLGKDIAGGHDGVVGNASIGTVYKNGPFSVQPSVTVNWGNDRYADSFFSVTEDQAAGSPLSEFDAGAGIYSYSLGVVSWVEFKERYALSLIGAYSIFTNDAEDSPIVNANDGSKNGLLVAVSLSRSFDTNKWNW